MTDNSSYIEFIAVWHQIMIFGSIGLLAISLILYLFHKLKVSGITEYKDKYDYINHKEINTYRVAFILVGIAAAFITNTYNDVTVVKSIVWFFVRFFISMCIGTLIGYVSVLVLVYYYPGKMQKKLDKWRFMPRVNPKTGNKMKLLSEEEEDVHLDEGMQAEEDVFSVDYDVWIDEQSGDTRIEKYDGYMEALKCGSCGFQTLKIQKEEIVVPATTTEVGELLKHYECSYCKSKRTTANTIAKLTISDSSSAFKKPSITTENDVSSTTVEAIKIQIVDNDGNSKMFEFQNLGQAEQFLKEYK